MSSIINLSSSHRLRPSFKKSLNFVFADFTLQLFGKLGRRFDHYFGEVNFSAPSPEYILSPLGSPSGQVEGRGEGQAWEQEAV